MCLIRGSFMECLLVLFSFHSNPVPLILFTLPLSLSLFATIIKSSANARLQICSLPITLPPAYAFFNISFISARYIVNRRGLSGQPCLTPFVVSNHSPSFSPTFTLFFVLAYISSYQPFAYSSLSLSRRTSLSFFYTSNRFHALWLSKIDICSNIWFRDDDKS
jgi:hypothetical protein